MANKYVGAAKFIKNLITGGKQKTTGTEVIKSVKPSVPKNKSEKLKSQLKIATQKSKASQAKLDNTIFRIEQQKKRLEREKKMGGGFMGKRMGYKKGSKFPDLTGDGKVTFADILKGRGVINGKRDKKAVGGIMVTLGKAGKKFLKSKEGKEKLKEIDSKKGKEFTKKMLKKLKDSGFKGGGSTMSKIASDKTKAESKKFEKRAKAASKFVKNQGRKFGSIMREKYMR